MQCQELASNPISQSKVHEESLETPGEVTIVLVLLPYHLRYLFLGMLEFTTIVKNHSLFLLDVPPRVLWRFLSLKASKV